VVQHSGGMPGVSTLCSLIPSERLAIVVLSNGSSMLPGGLSDMIQKIVLPEGKKDATSQAKEDKDGKPKDKKSPSNPFVPSAEFMGKWKGHLTTYKSETPLVLEIRDTGDVHVRLGDQLETLLNRKLFIDGWLRGVFAGDIGTDDNRGRPYHLHLDLKLRGDVLNGPVTTITLPDAWGSSAVTHWIELQRQADKPSSSAPAGGE
jgi:hypothetical protein